MYKYIDLNGKIIIGSRCLASVMLWALCAVPFANLDAIILLGVMVGTVILLGNAIIFKYKIYMT